MKKGDKKKPKPLEKTPAFLSSFLFLLWKNSEKSLLKKRGKKITEFSKQITKISKENF